MNKPPNERLLTDEEIKNKWLGGWEEQNLESVDLEDLKNNLYYEDMFALKAVAKAQDAKSVRETLKMVGELVTRIQAGYPEPSAGSDHPYEPSYLMIDVKDWQALNQLVER